MLSFVFAFVSALSIGLACLLSSVAKWKGASARHWIVVLLLSAVGLVCFGALIYQRTSLVETRKKYTNCERLLSKGIETHRGNNSKGGKLRSRVSIVTSSTDNFFVAEVTAAITSKYVQSQDSEFVTFKRLQAPQHVLNMGLHPSWNKLWIIAEELDKLSDGDFVFWIDGDAAITNHEIDMAAFLDIIPAADFIIANHLEDDTSLNAGIFLVRKNAWSMKMMNLWRSAPDRSQKCCWEQDFLNGPVMKNFFDTSDGNHFAVADFCLLNGLVPSKVSGVPEFPNFFFVSHTYGSRTPIEKKLFYWLKIAQRFGRLRLSI